MLSATAGRHAGAMNPRWRRVLLSWFALPASALAALLVGAAMIAALGADPVHGYHALVTGAFGGSYALGSTAVKAIPLLLVGVGICIAFRANAFNIGGEGQIAMGVLARELSRKPRVLLAAQPTRGVDVGAARYIHERLGEQRDAGTAILVVSEDLDAVLTLSDRILVMYEGDVIAEADPRASTREAPGPMMAGSRAEGAGG